MNKVSTPWSNLGSEDDSYWFKDSPYWPKEKETGNLVKIIDALIRKNKWFKCYS